MSQYRTGEIDISTHVIGKLWVDEAVSLNGGATVTQGLSVDGTCTLAAQLSLTSIRMTQTLGGTDVTALWAGAGAPTLTTGNFYFTFKNGASTFRVPCWPTT